MDATRKPLARALPRELVESDVVAPLSPTKKIVTASRPVGCPVCNIARSFFILTCGEPCDEWDYRCVFCHHERYRRSA